VGKTVTDEVRRWYRRHGRDLPWRDISTTPWQSLVAEIMLAQTPVNRVAPVYREWVVRWPDAANTAGASRADIIRAWGRLGYPRRALRLHECAAVVQREHGGQPPADRAALLALPGVGEYTSAAVLAFAYGRRVEVLDTNVRRVLARLIVGDERAPRSITRAERELATDLLPARDADAAEWSIAVMELGALVCTAVAPACDRCPVSRSCAWLAAGRPPHPEPAPKGQAWEGTDRQCRGAIMALARQDAASLTPAELAQAWPDDAQRDRCLASLVADGLIERTRAGRYRLPA